jgi:hypothetical protein
LRYRRKLNRRFDQSGSLAASGAEPMSRNWEMVHMHR